MKTYDIIANPVSFDDYADLYDGELFVSLDTNVAGDLYAVIDANDEDARDDLEAALRRRYGRTARLLGYEDASYLFEDEDEDC